MVRALEITVGVLYVMEAVCAWVTPSPGMTARSRPTRLSLSLEPQQPRSSFDRTAGPLKAVVALATGGLNSVAGMLGGRVNPTRSSEAVRATAPITPTALLNGIRADYSQRCYFLTGDITSNCYDEDCVFTDPTISFKGLGTWKRNIQSLTLFIRQPKLELLDIQLDKPAKTIRTRWRLTCQLAFPWQPRIDVFGGTTHRYDPARGGRVVEHVESWDVSAFEAILQIFRPGAAPPLRAVLWPALMSLLGGAGGGLLEGGVEAMQSPGRQGLVAVARADDRRVVAEIPASGLIFKDVIDISAFKDPKVEGVTLYISDFRRPLTERLAKDFFSDPSQASVACVRTGPVKIGKIDMSKAGEEVFSEARSLLFKTIRVRRVYDPQAKALVYISYSTRLAKNDDDNKSRFKSSLCAVPLDEQGDAEATPGPDST